MERSLFNRIEQKTGVSMDEIMDLVQAIQHADFSSERQVRKIVQKVAKAANKPLPPKLERDIVKSIVEDGQSLSMERIEKMLNK